MKISLSQELSEQLTELRLISGYESTQALIRILLRLYADDFKSRFRSGTQSVELLPIVPKSDKPTVKVQPLDTQSALAKPNPPPDW
jgi:hypothetical protein